MNKPHAAHASNHHPNKRKFPSKPYVRSAIKRYTLPSKFGVTDDKQNPFKILSEPDKMPCPTFSLPARKSCPFAVFGNNAICSDCYACKGRYAMPNVIAPRATRFAWVLNSLKTESGKAELKARIIAAIAATGTKYFRGHDSGDFFNPEYVRVWIDICTSLPNVRFWFPTRAWQDGTGRKNPRMLTELTRLAALPNVAVRPSALYFGDSAPRVRGLSAGSTSDNSTTRQCVAYRQNGYCGNCRTCWEPDIEVSYRHH
jgi:Gene product 88